MTNHHHHRQTMIQQQWIHIKNIYSFFFSFYFCRFFSSSSTISLDIGVEFVLFHFISLPYFIDFQWNIFRTIIVANFEFRFIHLCGCACVWLTKEEKIFNSNFSDKCSTNVVGFFFRSFDTKIKINCGTEIKMGTNVLLWDKEKKLAFKWKLLLKYENVHKLWII